MSVIAKRTRDAAGNFVFWNLPPYYNNGRIRFSLAGEDPRQLSAGILSERIAEYYEQVGPPLLRAKLSRA